VYKINHFPLNKGVKNKKYANNLSFSCFLFAAKNILVLIFYGNKKIWRIYKCQDLVMFAEERLFRAVRYHTLIT